MNVFEIIKAHLDATRMDGLYVEDGCACDKDDLSPGDCLTGECEPGKWYICPQCGDRYMITSPSANERCQGCS